MILFLFEFLQALGLKIPSAFLYFSTRMILAAGTSLLFVIVLGPQFIKKLYEWKIGQPIRSVAEVPLLAELHGKKKDTPTMGGILILAGVGASLFLWMDLRSVFTLILLLTMVVLGFLGGIDDYLKLRLKNSKGLRGKKKLFVQVVFSSLLALYLLSPMLQSAISTKKWLRPPSAKEQTMIPRAGKRPEIKVKELTTRDYATRLYLPFFKDPVLLLPNILSFILIVFVITGASNAVNLTDGSRRACGGVSGDGIDGAGAFCLPIEPHRFGALFEYSVSSKDSGEIAVYLFRDGGRVPRIFVVQRLSGAGVYGRHGLACSRGTFRRIVDFAPARIHPRNCGRDLRGRSGLGDFASVELQVSEQKEDFSLRASASSFRVQGLAGDESCHPVLDY
jgi:phospho-N-acetylmuramoyl-pentapeptide-transferase